jgi:hypothetical protein
MPSTYQHATINAIDQMLIFYSHAALDQNQIRANSERKNSIKTGKQEKNTEN